MEEEDDWDEETAAKEDQPLPSIPNPPSIDYITVTKTIESLSSRTAGSRLPLDYIQSTKMYRRNVFLHSVFTFASLYAMAISVGSLLFVGGLTASLALFLTQLSISVYLLWMSRKRRFLHSLAPLKFLPVVVGQAGCWGGLLVRQYLRGYWSGTLWFQMVIFGVPFTAFFGYEMVLLLRSMGVQVAKKCTPFYYIYLNLT